MTTLSVNVLVLTLLAVSAVGLCADRKPFADVATDKLTTEGQVMNSANQELDFVWWIPLEFWEVTFAQNEAVSVAQVEQIIGILRPYSVLAAVQADISAMGSFGFFDRDAVMRGMLVEYIDEDGTKSTVSHVEPSNSDLRLMLDQMRPVLAAAMGNLGENFYFFPLPDTDDDGNRLVSPYKDGVLRITLGARENAAATVLEVALPLDSLHIPYICPNGKPAHISWNYCPWSGKNIH